MRLATLKLTEKLLQEEMKRAREERLMADVQLKLKFGDDCFVYTPDGFETDTVYQEWKWWDTRYKEISAAWMEFSTTDWHC